MEKEPTFLMNTPPPGRWMNPALAKGLVYALAGLITVALPGLSMVMLRFILALALLATGASDLWSHFRRRESRNGPVRALLALLAGCGLLLVPQATVSGFELVVAVYLAAMGLLALWQGRGREGARSRFAQGAFYLALALLVLKLPGAMVDLAVVSAAVAAMVVGLILISHALQHGPDDKEIVDRALVLEILRSWLAARDVGSDRRNAIADGLYFEAPDRTHKVVSYVIMLLLSVAIASLAILQDSTAVVIGAMLVAPLMTPIMGCAAGLVAGWRKRTLTSLAIVASSVAAAIGLAWILASWIPALVPIGSNSQVLSRSSPTLLDMAIAVVAGAAGAFATIDDRVSSSLTGVAIAVALVPPLGVVGIALEAGEWSSAQGASLLFVTNLVSIILVSLVVFVLVGFTPVRDAIQGRAKVIDLLTSVVVLALLIMVPLGLTGETVLKDATRGAQARRHAEEWLGSDSGLRLIEVETRGHKVEIVLSGKDAVPPLEDLEEAISRSFGVMANVSVELFPSVVLTYSSTDGAKAVESGVVEEVHDRKSP